MEETIVKAGLYSFATFVAGGPSAKITAVTEAKHPATYEVKTDWWKQLREFIPRNHKMGGTRNDLVKFANSVTQRKQNGYGDRVTAYNKWWDKNTIKSATGAALSWSAAGLDVTVNPELFLSVNGVRHVIKLYFKQSEKLTVDRANVVLRLLELSYRKGSSPGGTPVVGILDLAQDMFIMPSVSLAYLDPLLAGEAASFATIWPSV
jgi:hypothetical protein